MGPPWHLRNGFRCRDLTTKRIETAGRNPGNSSCDLLMVSFFFQNERLWLATLKLSHQIGVRKPNHLVVDHFIRGEIPLSSGIMIVIHH